MFSMRLLLRTLAPLTLMIPAEAPAPTGPESVAQSDVLDAATFSLWSGTQRIGREQWSLTRVRGADGVAIDLRAESATGDRRAALRIEADSAGTPVRLSLEERSGATMTRRVGGQRVRGRFATVARAGQTETSREMVLTPGAVLIDATGAGASVGQAALALFAQQQRGPAGGPVPLLALQATHPMVADLAVDSPRDTVTIANTVVPAVRWRLTAPGEPIRLLWVDPQGRLLRLQVSALAFDARRDDVARPRS
jgi:hypothetical protein